MIELFYTVLYEPLFNALIYIYDKLPYHDIGIAIILITLAIKILLFWPSLSALKSQKALQDAQPMMEEIKKKYKDDKEEMGRQLMKFYKDNKVNPLSSCLPLLIQLPILIALYRVFFSGLAVDPDSGLIVAEQLEHLYGYLRDVYTTTPLNTTFLGFVDMAKTHNIVLALLAGAAQFFQTKTLQTKKPAIKSKGSKDEGMAAMMNKQMMYFMPIITVVFGYQFPAGVTLYWLTNTLFSLGQQLYFFNYKKKLDIDDEKKGKKKKKKEDKKIVEVEAKHEQDKNDANPETTK